MYNCSFVNQHITFMNNPSALQHPRKVKALTFSQTVADVGIPGQQGVSAVEAQDQRAGQAEDGESVGHAVIAGPWLYTTDPLKEQILFYKKRRNLVSVN